MVHIPKPSPKDLSILPDSELSVSPYREEARRHEAARRRPHADLLSITPAVSTGLNRKAMHELAFDMGKEHWRRRAAGGVGSIRKKSWRQWRKELQPHARRHRGRSQAPRSRNSGLVSLAGAEVEAISLTVEDGIAVRFCCYGRREDSRLQWWFATHRQARSGLFRPLERNRSAVTSQA